MAEITQKSLKSLLDIILFVDNTAIKIHGKKTETQIFSTLRQEFRRSGKYKSSILLLTPDRKHLRMAYTSVADVRIRAAEKISRQLIGSLEIPIRSTPLLSSVLEARETVYTQSSDFITELLPKRFARAADIFNRDSENSMLTPLYRGQELIGIFGMTAPELADYFAPLVESFAMHIGRALELIVENEKRASAEALALDREQHFHRMFQSFGDPVVIWELDENWNPVRILEANPAAWQRLGYSREEYFKLPIERHGIPAKGQIPFLRDQFLKKGFVLFENTVTNRDGTRIPFELSATPIEYEGKRAAVVVVRDISERKKNEEQLGIFKRILETARDVIFFKDLNGVYRVANNAIASMIGLKLSRIIGRTDLEIFSDRNQAKEIMSEDAAVLGTGKPIESFQHLTMPSGKAIWFHVVKAPQTDAKGKITGLVGIARDVTKTKELEELLRENEKKLWASEHSLREFSRKILRAREAEAKMISADLHDEMGSMAVALGSSLELADREIAEGHAQKASENIQHTKSLLHAHIDGMRRLAARLRPANLEYVGLSGALRLLCAEVEKQSGLAIKFQTKGKECQVSENASIAVYRIAQEAMNNTVRHANAKRISVLLHYTQSEIKLSLRDDGRGFEATSIRNTSFGAHIGLRGMKERAELMNGILNIDSKPGQGCGVIVRIPIDKAPSQFVENSKERP